MYENLENFNEPQREIPPFDPETAQVSYHYPGIGDRVIQYHPDGGRWIYSCPICKREGWIRGANLSDTCTAFLMHYVTHLEMKGNE